MNFDPMTKLLLVTGSKRGKTRAPVNTLVFSTPDWLRNQSVSFNLITKLSDSKLRNLVVTLNAKLKSFYVIFVSRVEVLA